MNESSMKHFKAAQIAGMEVSLKDLEKINSYALSRLEPKDIFAFKVSMAGNEIDRDYEVFPRSTLVKLANLFVGKTVVKDHEHKSDNQIARIFSTELVENDLARMTKTGEVFTELIAKCYMVKTSANADLIAEIQAGIRKEVSLGCRVDKAVCSICGTDNVKTYCEHFPGKRYGSNQLCYFSLENASDAYELSFVAVPAQAHAGTVKSYGKKPCHEDEMKARKKTVENVREGLRTGKAVAGLNGSKRADAGEELTVPNEKLKAAENAPNEADLTPECTENAPDCMESGRKQPENDAKNTLKTAVQASDSPENPPHSSVDASDSVSETPSKEEGPAQEADGIDAKEMLKQLHEIAQQLLVFQKSVMAQKEAERTAPEPEEEQDSEQKSGEPQDESPVQEQGPDGNRLTVNQIDAEGQQGDPSSDNSPEDKGASPENASEEGGEAEKTDETAAEAEAKADEEASKAKTAQARLRALELALSLRKKN